MDTLTSTPTRPPTSADDLFAPRRIRVVVVDDHPVVADGFARLIDAEADMTVVGVAHDVPAALALLDRARPEVVVCDVLIGETQRGFEVLAKAAGTPGGPAVLMLSSYAYAGLYAHAIERGAAGYVLKTAPTTELLAAIRTVAAGGTSYPRGALAAARGATRRPSDVELEIIALVAAGRSTAEIAGQLDRSERTVETHLRRLFARYQLANRTDLAMFAVREGWIRPRVG